MSAYPTAQNMSFHIFPTVDNQTSFRQHFNPSVLIFVRAMQYRMPNPALPRQRPTQIGRNIGKKKFNYQLVEEEWINIVWYEQPTNNDSIPQLIQALQLQSKHQSALMDCFVQQVFKTQIFQVEHMHTHTHYIVEHLATNSVSWNRLQQIPSCITEKEVW